MHNTGWGGCCSTFNIYKAGWNIIRLHENKISKRYHVNIISMPGVIYIYIVKGSSCHLSISASLKRYGIMASTFVGMVIAVAILYGVSSMYIGRHISGNLRQTITFWNIQTFDFLCHIFPNSLLIQIFILSLDYSTSTTPGTTTPGKDIVVAIKIFM